MAVNALESMVLTLCVTNAMKLMPVWQNLVCLVKERKKTPKVVKMKETTGSIN